MSLKVKNVTICKVAQSVTKQGDLVAVEEPLEIRVGYGPQIDRQQRSISVTMRTPGNDFDLVMGFLFTEGVISSYDQVESIKYCDDLGKQDEKENVIRVELKPEVVLDFNLLQRHFYTTSSCGVCGKTSIDAVKLKCKVLTEDFKVSSSVVHSLPDLIKKSQSVFEFTGGIHGSALFNTKGDLLLLREDVGRHNALDKIIGALLLKNELPITQSILLLSGRTSFELVQKAARSGICVVIAIGAPSSLAVQFAKEINMTLIGFVSNQQFNVYSGNDRIVIA